MATNWWNIMVLQILITAVICSTGVELGDDSKLSNENMISLFKIFLEDTNNQHGIKENDKIDKIKDFYQPLTSLNGKHLDTENELKNEDLQQLTFENLQNMKSIDNFNKKRGKKNYVKLCPFKICNIKKSMEDYDNFIRYVSKKYYNNPQVLNY